MVLSTPPSVGASYGPPAIGRCSATPEEQEAMFARHRARVASEAEILFTPKSPEIEDGVSGAGGRRADGPEATEEPPPRRPIAEFSRSSAAEPDARRARQQAQVTPEATKAGMPPSPRFHAPSADQEDMIARLRARVGGAEATEADWTAMRSRSERRQRAWDAHVKCRITHDRRATRPPPRPSNQYCPALATTPARDQRLSSGAVRTLMVIRAVIGRDSGRIITRQYLAQTLGYSTRTAQRHLSLLRQYGYITTRLVNAKNGRLLGQRIQVTAKARPFWQAGGPDLSPLKPFPINGASEDWLDPAAFAKGFASKGRSSTPERNPPSG